MNKTAIKNFAIWARRKLISDITYKAGMLGITENGIVQPMKQSTRDLQFFDIGIRAHGISGGRMLIRIHKAAQPGGVHMVPCDQIQFFHSAHPFLLFIPLYHESRRLQ